MAKKYFIQRTINPVFGDLSGDFTVQKIEKVKRKVIKPFLSLIRWRVHSSKFIKYLRITVADIKYRLSKKILGNANRRCIDPELEEKYDRIFHRKERKKLEQDRKVNGGDCCCCCKKDFYDDTFADYVIQRKDMMSRDPFYFYTQSKTSYCRYCFCKKYNLSNDIQVLKHIFNNPNDNLFYCYLLKQRSNTINNIKYHIDRNEYVDCCYNICCDNQIKYLKEKQEAINIAVRNNDHDFLYDEIIIESQNKLKAELNIDD